MKKAIILLLTIMAATVVSAGASSAAEKPLEARLLLPSTEFAPGKSYTVLLEMDIRDGYHTNSAKPASDAYIPTRAVFGVSGSGATLGMVNYPEGEMKKFRFAHDKLSVYEGKVYIATSVTFPDDAKEPVTLSAVLSYQACTDEVCFLPEEVSLSAAMNVGAGGTPLNEDIFARHAAAGRHGGGLENMFEGFEGSIGVTGIFLVFVGGLALNLTPCVYPMIPVTVGFFGAARARSRKETLMHSIVYLLGMAAMYSAIGTIAAITGSLFGEMMQNTYVVVALVAVMLLLSISMFGAYDIIVPQSLLDLSSRTYGGFAGTFFMGLTVGIIAAPCVGPFVIGLLTFVGERQDPFLGFILFFVLALGLGLPLVVLAFFSNAIELLPRSGVWMVWVKKFFGVVLLGMAVYFAQPILPREAIKYLALAVMAGGGAYLVVAGRKIKGPVFTAFRFGIGITLIAVGVWAAWPAKEKAEGLKFIPYAPAAMEEALKGHKPVMLYFSADWCVPCRELKIFTFADERVMKERRRFVSMLVDLTRVDDANREAKLTYGVKGVPTVILFDRDGKEADRFAGFIPAEEFLEKLSPLLGPIVHEE